MSLLLAHGDAHATETLIKILGVISVLTILLGAVAIGAMTRREKHGSPGSQRRSNGHNGQAVTATPLKAQASPHPDSEGERVPERATGDLLPWEERSAGNGHSG